jgi:hypothetical protein
MFIGNGGNVASAAVQPVIVHATLNQAGKILELEALQTNGSTVSALQHVMTARFAARATPLGASPHLREAYINVQIRN